MTLSWQVLLALATKELHRLAGKFKKLH